MHFKNWTIAAALLASAGSISPAGATDCNQPAPTLDVSNQASYFDFGAVPIDSRQQQQLIDFASRLSGRWSGMQTELLCTGHLKLPMETATQYQVDAEITGQHNGAIKLEAEKETRRKVKIERVFLSPTFSDSRANRPTGSVTFADDNSIVFSDKYHVRNGRLAHAALRNSVRTVEELKKIMLIDDTLTIDRQTYVNGHLVSQDAWALVRR